MQTPLPQQSASRIRRLATAPFRFLAAMLEVVFSRRGLSIALLLVVTYSVCGGWLRPPINRDVRGYQLSWAVTASSGSSHELAFAPRPARLDSLCVPLLAVVAAGAVLVLIHPRWLGGVMGVLLATTMAAAAAAAMNHPLLIETFDQEIEQRNRISEALALESEHMLTPNAAPRVNKEGITSTSRKSMDDVLQGFNYLVFAPWLVALCLFGVFVGTSGNWLRRLRMAAIWFACGLLLAGMVSSRRMVGEWWLAQAIRSEQRNQLDEARAALDRMQAVFPELAATSFCWQLDGQDRLP